MIDSEGHRTPEEILAKEDREIELFGEDRPVMEAYYNIFDYITARKIYRDEDLHLAFEMVFDFIRNNEQ